MKANKKAKIWRTLWKNSDDYDNIYENQTEFKWWITSKQNDRNSSHDNSC